MKTGSNPETSSPTAVRDEKPKGTVLLVDDDSYVLSTISSLLRDWGHRVVTCGDSRTAVDLFRENSADVVLTDVKMPYVTGIDLIERIHEVAPDVPVILMTAYADLDTAVTAVKRGAFDFIIKPYRAIHLIHSVEKAVKYRRLLEMERNYKRNLEEMVAKRTQELADAFTMVDNLSREVVQRLTSVAEFKDTETGAHIVRIGLYARKIAKVLGMSEDFVETIAFASPMHDIGKIGIPDSIILKPGKLTFEEFEIIKSHTTIGEKMLSGSSYAKLQMAASIALNHHERWDGTGYPRGLKGEDIPIEGRIVMICDQYDALMSKRPYKLAFSHDQTMDVIVNGDGRTLPHHFDPEVLKAFVSVSREFEDIFRRNQG